MMGSLKVPIARYLCYSAVHMHEHTHTHACACGSQRTTLRSRFSTSTMYVQGINPDCRFSCVMYVRLVSCHVLFEFAEKLALEEPAIWLKNACLIDILSDQER